MNLTAAFSHKITRFVSDGKGVEVNYLNFRKVFDIVFFNKGGWYSLDGQNKQMAKKTWLDAQAQRVVVNRSYFIWVLVTRVVLQGSILGTILFKVFIDYLEEAMEYFIIQVTPNWEGSGWRGDVQGT